MTLFKKSFLVLSITIFIFSLLLVLIIVFISPSRLLIFAVILYLVTALFTVYKLSSFLSVSFGRLVNIVHNGVSLLPGSDVILVSKDFRTLEKTMRIITLEINQRFKQAKSESSRLEAVLNGMSEAVFAMNHSLRLYTVNPKARELFNLGNTDVKTMTLLEATRSAELAEIANKSINAGMPLEIELTFHSKNEKHFQVYASPIGNNNDGVILVLQEITRLVKLERVRKDFVANVSHELRTPIQLIKGFSEALLENQSDKQNVHFIEIIRKSAGTMENLTNDLLILADLENNLNNTRDMEELNVLPIIQEAVSSLEIQAKNKNIEIIINCDENLKTRLYGSLILQALINLIDNGIKYSAVKSKIWVSVYLNDNRQNEEVVFEVRDKGIGIPAEHMERLFERFYRADKARNSDGTGLGLSIVRHIALLHKGNAEAESHAGEGSVFRIKIPRT
ncbi:MAG: HAMP domain-containing histidine kinase [Treponema sp.]|nr:HAMP domain-containing histidine kinase [Treponema sp.]